jgi:hypothetical protein
LKCRSAIEGMPLEKDVGKRQIEKLAPTLHQPFSSSGRPMRLIATCFASRVEAKPGIYLDSMVLCPAATSSYDSLVFGMERTKMIMKPEKISRMNVFGEHFYAWSGRRAQDQTLRLRACAPSSSIFPLSRGAMTFDRVSQETFLDVRWRDVVADAEFVA